MGDHGECGCAIWKDENGEPIDIYRKHKKNKASVSVKRQPDDRPE